MSDPSRVLSSLAAVVVGVLSACSVDSSSSRSAAVLGTAESFTVLGGSTVTNTGATTIVGNLGVSPGLSVTGFPPGLVTGGAIHAGDAVALQAQADLVTAYDHFAGQTCDRDLTGHDLGGLTLTAGVYCFSSSAQLTGQLTLDAEGHPDALFVFQIASTLTTASNASVLVINAAQTCNTYWQVGSSATLGTTTTFAGNILALSSITLTTGARVFGRALARNGAVTMDGNHLEVGTCFGPSDVDAGAPPPIDAAIDAVCPGFGETTCGDETCVDLLRDRDHCGACDNVCAADQGCEYGACTCPVCAEDEHCLDGACLPN